MIEAALMVSNGGDTNKYRDCANDTLTRLQHMFLHQLEIELHISNWDYRLDPPTVVPAGAMAARSLVMVNRSHGLLAIFGPSVPKITSKEVWEAFERRRRGDTEELWTFVNPNQLKASHTKFFNSINKEFGEEISWTPYHNEVEFQAALFTTLVPYLLRRAGVSLPKAAGGAI